MNRIDSTEASVAADAERSIEIIERQLELARRRLFTLEDALFLLQWPALRIAAAIVPERRWAGVAMWLERLKARLGVPSPTERAAAIGRCLGIAARDEAEAIAWRSAAARTEHHIQVMKVMSRAGWAPEIRLEGEERLAAALASGKGAVLWVAHFCFNTQVTKMALWRRGYRVAHLSRPEHGFSASRFGLRYLNPLRSGAELKYLARRIVIDRARPGEALSEARSVLAVNGIVSITAGAWEGRRLARGSLLGARFALAAGAPRLARQAGAALLPVVTTRGTDGGAFCVTIGAPLQTNSADERHAIRAATSEFLAVLETAVRQHPDQWRGWKYLDFA